MARSTKMILLYMFLFVFGITYAIEGSYAETGDRNSTHPYCFQFTWLGRTPPGDVNCSIITDTPCMPPLIVTEDYTPPNVTWMWNNINQTAISCPLAPGYACIKYSYTYNDAVVNISYFCGKIMEDQTTAVSSGCYNQKIRGHIIEVCACKSRGGGIPCNSSVKAESSMKMLITLILISMLLWDT